MNGNTLVTRVRRGDGSACEICSCNELKGSKGPHRLRVRGTVSISGARPTGCNAGPFNRGRRVSNNAHRVLARYPLFDMCGCRLYNGIRLGTGRRDFGRVLIISNDKGVNKHRFGGNSDFFIPTGCNGCRVSNGKRFVLAGMWRGACVTGVHQTYVLNKFLFCAWGGGAGRWGTLRANGVLAAFCLRVFL